MAYNTRFTINFNDFFGTPYRCEIKQDGYSGASSELIAGAGGFRLFYSGNNKGLQNYVVGSKVSMDIQITTATEKEFIKDLATNPEKTFLLNISKDTGSGHVQFWVGYIMADLVNFQDAPFPFSFNITAADGFGFASKIDYTNSVWTANNEPSDVYRTHTQLLVECLDLVGLLGQMDAAQPIMLGEVPYWETNAQNLSQTKLEVTRVNTKTFAQYDGNSEGVSYTYTSALRVLEEICKTWNAKLLQWDGKVWFVPHSLYLNATADFFPMAANTVTGVVQNIDLFAEVADFNRFVGGTFDFDVALKKACVDWQYYYDPLDELSEEPNPCGTSIAPFKYDLLSGLNISNFNGYNGGADAAVNLDFKYNLFWGYGAGDPATPPTNYRIVMKFRVDSGEYRLINDIDTAYTPTTALSFTNAEWKRGGDATYMNFTGGETSIDISNMDCFGLPNDDTYIYVYVDGETVSGVKWQYDANAQTITFVQNVVDPVTIAADTVVTVAIDYTKTGVFYVDVTDSFNIETYVTAPPYPNGFNDTLQSIVLNLGSVPSSGITVQSGKIQTINIAGNDEDHYNSDFYLIARSDEVGTYNSANLMYLIPVSVPTNGSIISRQFRLQGVSANGIYKAQPTNSSQNKKDCEENNTTSITDININMITGDNAEYATDSTLQVFGGGQWIDATNWQFNNIGVTHSGHLGSNIAKLNTHLQQKAVLRYNGNIQRAGSEFFSPISGLKMVTFNATADNLMFASGEFIAADAEWRVQLLQLGV